jgi:hypothetical protein
MSSLTFVGRHLSVLPDMAVLVRRWERLRSTATSLSHDADGAGAAHRVFEQLERDGISDAEIVEDCALAQVPTVKEHLAIIPQADEAMALPDHDLGNATGRRPATRIVPCRLARTFRRTFARGAVEIFSAHMIG